MSKKRLLREPEPTAWSCSASPIRIVSGATAWTATLSNADVVKACERVIPVRVDVNTAPELARQYGIEGVPSFIFVEGSGDEVGRIVGFLPAPIFLDRLQQVLDDQQKVVDLRKQVSENPNDYEAKANLARIYIERRQGDLAARWMPWRRCPG